MEAFADNLSDTRWRAGPKRFLVDFPALAACDTLLLVMRTIGDTLWRGQVRLHSPSTDNKLRLAQPGRRHVLIAHRNPKLPEFR